MVTVLPLFNVLVVVLPPPPVPPAAPRGSNSGKLKIKSLSSEVYPARVAIFF
ncbi:MAG: hypothetical protein ACK55Z_00440 [bacterium]